MRTPYSLVLAPALAMVLFACGNDPDSATIDDTDSLALDSLISNIPVDADSLVAQDTVGTQGIETEPEQKEDQLQELKKDEFCECIRWQYKINKQMQEAQTDAEIDAVFEEQDKFDKSNCKNILAGNQNSIDAKAEHEAKVAGCLRGMK